LHDFNGLLIGPPEQRPNLTLIVHNDDGGGIFTLLEQGAAEYKYSFERVFGTPHGADIESLCRGYHVEYVHPTTSAELRAALAPGRGVKVVEVRSDRALLRDLHARLRAAVVEAALR
jgi:2-succinyl-5-enolpyruvyl-6-hydroxy-3-cyclohexene-1-carboxylate synthase